MEGEKRLVGYIDATPSVSELIHLIQVTFAEGNGARAFELLSAGWPEMTVDKAYRLVKDEITIEEALTKEE